MCPDSRDTKSDEGPLGDATHKLLTLRVSWVHGGTILSKSGHSECSASAGGRVPSNIVALSCCLVDIVA